MKEQEDVLDRPSAEKKTEILGFTSRLQASGVAKVSVCYNGSSDEGRTEAPQLEDASGKPIDSANLSVEPDLEQLAELLEYFVPEGYEDDLGGHGTITFDVGAQKIIVQNNHYVEDSVADEPWEI